jgi:8-oxo-dGTP pyrophosphatase MutT (NUDIX family)
MKKESYSGSIIIFYKKDLEDVKYLIVENTKTGNITFVAGAQENDESLLETAIREVKEELNLDSNQYTLNPTDIYHNFIFEENKKERAGAKGSYRVFLADASNIKEIIPTKELKIVWWKNKEGVLNSLSFSDLKDVFQQALNENIIYN